MRLSKKHIRRVILDEWALVLGVTPKSKSDQSGQNGSSKSEEHRQTLTDSIGIGAIQNYVGLDKPQ